MKDFIFTNRITPLGRKLLGWGRARLALTVIAVFVLLIIAVLAVRPELLIEGLACIENWRMERLPAQIASTGMVAPYVDIEKPQPPLSMTSPDGAWTLTANWIPKDGYDWALKNNVSGKTFPQKYPERFPGGLDWAAASLSASWSPDNRYVAVTTSWSMPHVHVISLARPEPQVVALKPGMNSIEENTGSMPPISETKGSKALKWINGSDLLVLTYKRGLLDTQPAEIDTVLQNTFHFDAASASIMSSKTILHEDFITDL